MNELWFRLIVLAILVSYLVKNRWNQKRLRQRDLAARRAVPGHGFNAAPITPRIQALRQHYVESARGRRPRCEAQREFIAKVRSSLGRLGFFARHEAGSAIVDHPPTD